MKNYFRVQQKDISFAEMQVFNSYDGGDGYSEGLAVSISPAGLDGGSKFGGAWDAMDDDDEVVVMTGTIICKIYDGYRIRPVSEVARFTVSEWAEMLEDGRAWEFETL